MYHYVRDVELTQFPKIKSASVRKFRTQLQQFQRLGTVISVDQLLSSLESGEVLPPNSVLLSFDDGYREHFDVVTELLVDAGVTAAFYPPALAIERRVLLDVNKVHFLLASTSTDALVRQIDTFVDANQGATDILTKSEYHRTWAIANRWDDAETIYVKRMLQAGLPEESRAELADALFSKYVTSDSRAFADELYLNVSQLQSMHAAGMHIGSHTVSHRWLNTLSRSEQHAEIVGSLDFLKRSQVLPHHGFTIAYPFGGYDQATLDVLDELGCRSAFTVHPRIFDLQTDLIFEIPRVDTNDIAF